MKKQIGKKLFLGLLVSMTVLTVNAAAEEAEAAETLDREAPIVEELDTVYFDAAFIDLDVTGWADVGGGEVSLLETYDYEAIKETLREGIKDKKAEIQLTGVGDLGADQLAQLYSNTLYDYPEDTYFATTGDISFSIYSNGTIGLSPCYLQEYDSDAYERAVNAAVSECFTDGMTDLEKIVAAHDWIVLNCQYDPYVANEERDYTAADGTTYTENERVYTSYGVFVEGNAVCQGYALAFKVLMDRAGIDCCYANGVGHAWNMVKLDDSWYHVDATWDDPVYTGAGDLAGHVSRYYFMKSDDEFLNPGGSLQVHSAWTTEYGYTAEDACALPDGLGNAQDMPAYLIGGAFYLADSSGAMYRYRIGGGFQNAELIASGLPVSIQAVALDEENNVLYFLSNFTRNMEGTEYWWSIYELDFNEAVPAARLKQYTEHTGNSKVYGLKIRENPDFPGTKELCTWYDYTPAERIPIGLAATDAGMPVVIRYAPEMLRVADLAGKAISVSAGEDCAVYLACYGSGGKMLGIAGLGTAEAGTETVMEISASAVAEGTASAQIITLASGTGKPLASPIRIA